MKFLSVAMMAAVAAGLSIDEPAWCHRDSDCRQNGDNGARCIGAPGNCACSLGFGARKVGDVSVPLCFRNSRSLSLTATFKAQATCYPEAVFSPLNKKIVLEWVRTIVNASSVPQSAIWTCSGSRPQLNVVLNHEGGFETYNWGTDAVVRTLDFTPSENAAKLTALLGTTADVASLKWDQHKLYDCVFPVTNPSTVRSEFQVQLGTNNKYDTNSDYDISAAEINATRVVGSGWKAAWKFLIDNDVNKDGVVTYREFAYNKYIAQEKPTAAVLAKWSVNEDVAGGHITQASIVSGSVCLSLPILLHRQPTPCSFHYIPCICLHHTHTALRHQVVLHKLLQASPPRCRCQPEPHRRRPCAGAQQVHRRDQPWSSRDEPLLRGQRLHLGGAPDRVQPRHGQLHLPARQEGRPAHVGGVVPEQQGVRRLRRR